MSTGAPTAAGEGAEAITVPAGRPVMVVGVDESEHSYHALQWALQHFFAGAPCCPPLFSLVVVHAKPTPASVTGFGSPGAADVWPYVESNLREIAAGVVNKARELCIANSVSNVLVEVVEGEARAVLCKAVQKHRAIVLVLGSHGYGAIRRTFLGSVSDYCVHHADCTVMIVKKP